MSLGHSKRCKQPKNAAKPCIRCNPDKVTYYTTKLYCDYCAANYPEFTLGDE